MSHYGIVATHWNVALAEIDEVQLHKVVRQGEAKFGLAPGNFVWCADVASLIESGHTVWVIVKDSQGRYRNTDRIRVEIKDGGRKSLYSCADDGTPTSALIDVPRYIRSDDPISKSAKALLAKTHHGATNEYPTLTESVDEEDTGPSRRPRR